jgi:hypothetical protein
LEEENMAVVLVGVDAFPTYIALSTDLNSGSICGTPLIGKTLYTTDDRKWYIIAEASGSGFYAPPFVTPALQS